MQEGSSIQPQLQNTATVPVYSHSSNKLPGLLYVQGSKIQPRLQYIVSQGYYIQPRLQYATKAPIYIKPGVLYTTNAPICNQCSNIQQRLHYIIQNIYIINTTEAPIYNHGSNIEPCFHFTTRDPIYSHSSNNVVVTRRQHCTSHTNYPLHTQLHTLNPPRYINP